MKKFFIKWGTSYVAREPAEVGIEAFTESEGWDEADIDAIKSLEVGEAYSFDLSGDSTVTRIE